jgi:hypothetical protein
MAKDRKRKKNPFAFFFCPNFHSPFHPFNLPLHQASTRPKEWGFTWSFRKGKEMESGKVEARVKPGSG